MPADPKQSPYLSDSIVECPIGLVITRAGDRTNAMTVQFFSEVAHHPTSMWISIERSSYTHELLLESGSFSFITLERGQAQIAMACGTSSGREADKCRALDLYESGGFLFLRGALASTACRIFRSVPLGQHTMFLAEMLSGNMHRGRAPVRNLLLSDLKEHARGHFNAQ